jgi:hypothetical protein
VLLVCKTHADVGCPIYFLCNTGHEGFGDQLEHYVYCSYCAKLLNATVVLDGFHGGPSHHHGTGEYREVASLLGLGLDFNLNWSFVEHLDTVDLSFSQVHSLHDGIVNGSHEQACNILYKSDIQSCPELEIKWCDFMPTYASLKNVLWKLRHANARQKCFERRLGFELSAEVNIIWHVRVGDRCLHCDDPRYFTSLYERITPHIFSAHRLVFESQGPVGFLERHESFKSAIFYRNATLMDTVCRFLTSDILITSGSSLPAFVAAFSPPWSPIVLEERRKEASLDSNMAHHFLTKRKQC